MRDRVGRVVATGTFLAATLYGWFAWQLEIAGGEFVQEVFWSAVVLGPGALLGFGPLARYLDRKIPLERPAKASFVLMMTAMTGSILGMTARMAIGLSRGWGG